MNPVRKSVFGQFVGGKSVWIALVVAAAALPGCASADADRAELLEREALELTADRDAARQQLAEAMRREESLARQGEIDAAEIERMRREQADIDAKAREALARAQEYAAQNEELMGRAEGAAGLQDENSRLQEALARFKAQGADAKVTPDGNIEITLPSDVTFGSGQAKLTSAGKRNLQSLRGPLGGEYAAYELRVIGHTDDTPLRKTKAKWGTNRALGQARALAVVEFLEQNLGIAPTRLTTASKGEHEPKIAKTDKASRTKNRRVELVVVVPRESALSMAK